MTYWGKNLNIISQICCNFSHLQLHWKNCIVPAAILDDRKSLLIAFLVISDQYTTFVSSQNVCSGHIGWPKITFDRISRHFRSIHNFYIFVHKMAAGGHFGWSKITFDRISRHFRSIRNYYFCPQNGCRRPFGWPKITFDCISHHFRLIRNFFYFFQNGRRWPFWKSDFPQKQ